MQESFTVCMCNKIGVCVCVCVCVFIMLLTQYHRYYEESCYIFIFGTYMCRIPLQFVCVMKLVCLCVFVDII